VQQELGELLLKEVSDSFSATVFLTQCISPRVSERLR
jgi:hypothetical protein